MPIYMQVPFATGNVTASGYEGWIDVEEIHMEVDKNLSMEAGSLITTAKGKPKFSRFAVSKLLDDSSGGFMQEAGKISGDLYTFVIALTESGESSPPREFARFELKDALIAKFSIAASGDDPLERVEIAYNEITAEYTPRERGNKKGSKVVTSVKLDAPA